MSETIKVYPHPSLAERREYVPGVGNDGTELPKKEAEALLDAGLVTKTARPGLNDFHQPAEPEPAAPEPAPPAEPKE